MDKFKLEPFVRGDTCLEIYGPDRLFLRIDYDDVDPGTVEKATKKLVRILNENWESL
jgi:hypothetical protein